MSNPRLVFSRGRLDGVLFDMDGVVTQTATVHAAAWKAVFDAFLLERAGPGGSFQPFDAEDDYLRYVDGKSRYDGVLSFLRARDILLPSGTPEDLPGLGTVCAIGNKKDEVFEQVVKERGVEAFQSTVDLLQALRHAGFKTGIFSASQHAVQVLSAANLLGLFDARVDGIDAEELGLPGKPNPSTLLEIAKRLSVDPSRAAVVEDAIAGVQAGKAGRFALVIGVNREGRIGALLEHGADVEVRDLSEISIADGF